MSDREIVSGIPTWQQAIRDKCYHPTGTFIPFEKEEIEQSIPERFEKIVELYPDRLAVKDEDSELTYEELNRAANRIAHAILQRRGEGQEPIALLLEQGAQAIAAILGVLKTGRAYVPLDPSLPKARTALILESSQASLIMTDSKNIALTDQLARNDKKSILVDELDATVSTRDPGLFIPSERPAWIIYTSGSTGQPKGVVQSHRNVLHMTMNYTNNFHICAEDRLSLLFSHSVNAGAYGTFIGLLTGAALFSLDVRKQALKEIARWLIKEKISVCCSVPTVFRQFAGNSAGDEPFPDLRLIYLSGEPMYTTDFDVYRKRFSQDCIFVNRLGSTEMDAIRMYFMNKETNINGHNVPTGYPIQDKYVLLLDDAGHEAGVNEIGEIAVKSRYISPGYWQRPDLTRERFLPDPGGGDEYTYLSGDLGVLRPDGCLLNMGRKDFQVKIRGHRVEVSEVEAALLNLGLKEAVVVLREDRPGDPRLVAYFVSHTEPAPAAIELRRSLSETLPEYMIPFAFVKLDALPQTPNGKVDRRALPAPGRARVHRI